MAMGYQKKQRNRGISDGIQDTEGKRGIQDIRRDLGNVYLGSGVEVEAALKMKNGAARYTGT